MKPRWNDYARYGWILVIIVFACWVGRGLSLESIGGLLLAIGGFASREHTSLKALGRDFGQAKRNSAEGGTGVHPITLFSEPELVTAKSATCPELRADFLLGRSATIVLGVLVQERGEGLRNTPEYRYVLAHSTGRLTGWNFGNLFCVRYAGKHGAWQLLFTNQHGQGKTLSIADSLPSGWHQLAVAWSPTGGYMAWDNSKGMRETFDPGALSRWPQGIAPTVSLGCFHGGEGTALAAHHFCETKLWKLKVYPTFLPVGHSVLEQHLREIQQGA